MEVAECTKILSSRVQKIEPENFTKIIGYLLLNYDEKEIIEYAYGPDEAINSLISESKAFLSSARNPNTTSIMPVSQPLSDQLNSYSPFLSPSSFRDVAPYRDHHLPASPKPFPQNSNRYPLSQAELLNLEERLQSLKLLGPDFSNNYHRPEAPFTGGLGSVAGIRVRSPPDVPDFSSRACHYFQRGFCKHGISCRYPHVQPVLEDLPLMHGPDMHELLNDDHDFEPGSLEKLEMEIIQLLRVNRGMPVSIAALPLHYQEMYGKALQAEGYLTESQRHGKTGISLTKLLARLKNVQLIDRPHGQHSVVLMEDVPKYVEHRSERDESVVLGSSNQIYLTFPAESTFTEEDVANYFKRYGPVCDVRVPRQEKRMFGFVSFLYPETVKLILSKGHPHCISGARVLVKPYKEKTRQNDRRYPEKMDHPMYYPNNYYGMDPEINSFPRVRESPRILEEQLIQHRRQALELERRRLCDMWLTAKSQRAIPSYDHRLNELNISEDQDISLPELKLSSPDDEKNTHSSNSSDKDSQYGLPDSPFSHAR